MINKIFPFLRWFKDYDLQKFKLDLISGLTVALVLIPQSMAYAQLAGLPPFYGLYAAFLPPMVAALFGSSRQLQTGPVAIVSLMTAATLEPLATAGSEAYIAYAIILAITIGVFQLLLGVLRLGLIINFLSHPVVNGFTNAGAIIIATSQLSKLFGVYVDNAPHHYETIYNIIVSAINYTHVPTLLLALLSFAIMYGIKKFNPKIPYVLVAVIVTTVISYTTGYVDNKTVSMDAITEQEVKDDIKAFNMFSDSIITLNTELALKNTEFEKKKDNGASAEEKIVMDETLHIIQLRVKNCKQLAGEIKSRLRSYNFEIDENKSKDSKVVFALISADAESHGNIWRIKVGNKSLDETALSMMGGGDIVGAIPEGLPTLAIPELDFPLILKLLPFAIIISLLGFMEAIAIAKAMASKTGQKIDPNQELVGQGLGNIIGAIGQSYPVSGSFSRSAVNLQSGAVTGISSVLTSAVVILVLLFFTPLLYYLPKSVLATIIMMAVIGIINISGFIHTWKAKWYDGLISIITFVMTLLFAPHLENGIYIGVILSLVVYLYKSMKPKVSELSRHPDHSLRDIHKHGLGECEHIALLRFEGPLFFANANHLEEEIDIKISDKKKLKHIIIVANAITDVDATGEEALSLLINRLRSAGYGVGISGVVETVMDVFKRTHLYELIGDENIYPTMEKAINSVYFEAHKGSTEAKCPLVNVQKYLNEGVYQQCQ